MRQRAGSDRHGDAHHDRHDAAQHPRGPQPRERAAVADEPEDRVEPRDHPPVRRPVQHVARARAAHVDGEHAAVPAQHPGRAGLAGRGRDGARRHHRRDQARRGARARGRLRLHPPGRPARDRRRDRPADRVGQAERQHDLPRPLHLRGDDDRQRALHERRRRLPRLDGRRRAPDRARRLVADRCEGVLVPRRRHRREAAPGPARRLGAPGRRRHRRAGRRHRPPRRQDGRGARRARAQRSALEPARGGARPPRRGRGGHAQAALRDRGRRHRQGDDRVQLATGRLPGGAQGGGQHHPPSLMDFLR